MPNVQFLSKFLLYDQVVIEAHEHYQKRSYRNRCRILGANGVMTLSVPLEKGKHQQQPIRQVRISYDQPWHMRMWQTIRSAYGSAPYFAHYGPPLENILMAQHTYLFELNLACLDFLLDALDLPGYTLSQTYAPDHPYDLREKMHPVLPAADQDFRPPEYVQVFADRQDFEPNLSGIDLLMCCGPGSRPLLETAVRRPDQV